MSIIRNENNKSAKMITIMFEIRLRISFFTKKLKFIPNIANKNAKQALQFNDIDSIQVKSKMLFSQT